LAEGGTGYVAEEGIGYVAEEGNWRQDTEARFGGSNSNGIGSSAESGKVDIVLVAEESRELGSWVGNFHGNVVDYLGFGLAELSAGNFSKGYGGWVADKQSGRLCLLSQWALWVLLTPVHCPLSPSR